MPSHRDSLHPHSSVTRRQLLMARSSTGAFAAISSVAGTEMFARLVNVREIPTLESEETSITELQAGMASGGSTGGRFAILSSAGPMARTVAEATA